MSTTVEQVCTLQALRDFVHATLCARENLVPEQFQMQELQLRKSGRPCGLQFSLHGPRQLRLSAVWAADRNVLYFYDPAGVRFLKTLLPHRVCLEGECTAA